MKYVFFCLFARTPQFICIFFPYRNAWIFCPYFGLHTDKHTLSRFFLCSFISRRFATGGASQCALHSADDVCYLAAPKINIYWNLKTPALCRKEHAHTRTHMSTRSTQIYRIWINRNEVNCFQLCGCWNETDENEKLPQSIWSTKGKSVHSNQWLIYHIIICYNNIE